MIPPNKHSDPFEVVATALGCNSRSLSLEAGMYRTHGWDSLGHISVIVALQDAYNLRISDEELMSLVTMKAIVEFCERAGKSATT